MPFGPAYSALPLAAATPTRPAFRYVDEAAWNSLLSQIQNWPDNVNANGKNLSDVSTLTAFAAIAGSGGLKVESPVPTVTIRATTGGTADQRLYRFYSDGSALIMACHNDADTVSNNWLVLERTGAAPIRLTFHETTRVLRGTGGAIAFPGGNWAGQIFNQSDDPSEGGLVVGNRYAAAASSVFRVGSLFDNGNGFDTYFDIDGAGRISSPSLPTSNPGPGKWWSNGGVVTVGT